MTHRNVRCLVCSVAVVLCPRDWRRLERSECIRAYLSAVIALIDESWLLLCAVSLFVKDPLCQAFRRVPNASFARARGSRRTALPQSTSERC